MVGIDTVFIHRLIRYIWIDTHLVGIDTVFIHRLIQLSAFIHTWWALTQHANNLFTGSYSRTGEPTSIHTWLALTQHANDVGFSAQQALQSASTAILTGTDLNQWGKSGCGAHCISRNDHDLVREDFRYFNVECVRVPIWFEGKVVGGWTLY